MKIITTLALITVVSIVGYGAYLLYGLSHYL